MRAISYKRTIMRKHAMGSGTPKSNRTRNDDAVSGATYGQDTERCESKRTISVRSYCGHIGKVERNFLWDKNHKHGNALNNSRRKVSEK